LMVCLLTVSEESIMSPCDAAETMKTRHVITITTWSVFGGDIFYE
jgi:hypothetical protein